MTGWLHLSHSCQVFVWSVCHIPMERRFFVLVSFSIFYAPYASWHLKKLVSFQHLKYMKSSHIFICKKDLLWSVTFLQNVSSPTYLGCGCGGQEYTGGVEASRHLCNVSLAKGGMSAPCWCWRCVAQGELLAPRFLHGCLYITPVFSLQQGTGLCVHLVRRSSGWEKINLDTSLYWSILRFTCAGKFFLCKQAELIEPLEWASLNSFLLSSVSSSDAFWCATHLALSAGEVKKVKWRWEHFIHNFYELFRPAVSLPLGNICFLIAV